MLTANVRSKRPEFVAYEIGEQQPGFGVALTPPAVEIKRYSRLLVG
jgi:hypothetical protein